MPAVQDTELKETSTSFRPTLFLIAGRIIAFAVTFFIPVILVRLFDQVQFGTYKQVFLIYATLFPIAQMGMAESLYYFLPLDRERGGRYVLNSMMILLGSGLVCLGVLAAFPQLTVRWLGNAELQQHALKIAFYLLFVLVAQVLEISMISRQRYRKAAVTYAISDISRALSFLIPALLFRTIDALLAGGIVWAAGRIAYCAWYMRDDFGRGLRFDGALLRRQLAYALPFELSVIVEIVQGNFHQYAVSYHFAAAVFAIYSVGCLQLPFVDFVASPACNVMMVRMGEQLAARRHRAILLLWHDTTRKLALIFVPLFVLLVISAHQLIRLLFTDRYIAAVPIFTTWSIVVVLAVFQTDGLMRVYAQTRYLLMLNVIRLTVIVSLIGLFLRLFSLQGAVMITLTGTVIHKSLALLRARRLIGVTLVELLPWRRLAAVFGAAAAAAVPALLVRGRIEVPDFATGHTSVLLFAVLALMGTAYAVAYVGMLFGFDLLEDSEKAALTGWIRRRRAARTPRPEPAPPAVATAVINPETERG